MGRDPGPHPGELRTPVRGAALALLFLSLGAILFATLSPQAIASDLSAPWHCILCGSGGLSNLVRNFLLFLPLGLSLGVLAASPILAWLLAGSLSGSIELVQLVIPGRNSLLVDFLMNTAGAGFGIALARSILWGRRPRRPFWVATVHTPLLWLSLSASTLLSTGFLLSPAPTSAPIWVQWQPSLGHLPDFSGALLGVHLGEDPLPEGRHGDPSRLTSRLFAGERLILQVEPDQPTPRERPLLRLMGEDGNQLLLVSIMDNDLLLHPPYLASRLRLSQPNLKAPDIFHGWMPGAVEELEIRYRPTGACAFSRLTEVCGLRPGMDEGWALLYFSSSFSRAFRTWLGAIWLFFLGLVSGLAVRSRGATLTHGTILTLAAFAAATLPNPGVALSFLHIALILGGLGVGFLMRVHLYPRLWRTAA